ncbi:MAG: hypothetical protein WCB85_10330 [Candidatus Dormiibacterota bacterium]
MVDWPTVASLVTAGTTLTLAVATFVSVRAGNRTARAAERALQVSLRPVLAPSRLQDPPQKVMFVDNHWVMVEGGLGSAEVADQAIYLVMSIRNVGNGLAVLHGWQLSPGIPEGGRAAAPAEEHPSPSAAREVTVPRGDPRFWGGPLDPGALRRLTRDIYVPAGDIGFWQGAFRDPTAPEFAVARAAVESRSPLGIQLMYGDDEGGQRTVSLFTMRPRDDGRWLVTVARHWFLDRASPR